MSKRLQVLAAVRSMIQAACPYADVVGVEGDAAAPGPMSPGGRIIVRYGDPGDPEVDLSPPTYNYQHAIPVEVMGPPTDSETAAQVVDRMLSDIADAIVANRTLGGLVDYLDGAAPPADDITAPGATALHGADASLVAIYSTTRPL